ncbi:MAG: hypothetical protein NTY35_02370 [Planctomycetota bacterium]|nr:hypothetical protein [Planctomycetota bacterium]
MKILKLLAAVAFCSVSASAQGVYIGTSGPDFLGPTDENADYYGNEGDDVLWGGAGDDFLHGGTGFDILFDDEGGDVFYSDDCEVDVVYAIDNPDGAWWPDSINADTKDIILCDDNDTVRIWDCEREEVVFFGSGKEYYEFIGG